MVRKFFLFSVIILSVFSCSNNASDKVKRNNKNPLLQKFNPPFNVPPFNLIKNEHYIPAIKEAIRINNNEIKQIIENNEEPTFENTIAAFDSCGILSDNIKNIFTTVLDEGKLEIAKKIFPLLAQQNNIIFQNKKLFTKINKIYKQKDSINLNPEQKNLLNIIYYKFIKTGINLGSKKQNELNRIDSELAELEIEFINNLQSGYQTSKLSVSDKKELKGLSENSINIAKNLALQNKQPKKWMFSLRKTSFLNIMRFAENKGLRKKMFLAYTHFAANNKNIVNKIVNLRLQKAEIFGFKNYADYVLGTDERMFKNSDEVLIFLKETSKIYFNRIKNEATELQKVTENPKETSETEPWDWWFYEEKYKKEIIKLNKKELKPYFEFQNTLNGLFSFAEKMFNIKLTESTNYPVYNDFVRVFDVSDKDGSHIGVLYINFYSEGNNTGPVKKQYLYKGRRISPVVSVNYNFSKEFKTKKTFLTLKQTKTLYHEFGHALYELLSKNTYYNTSANNTAFDFIEFPSQFIERYALRKENLKLYAKNYKTGEIIPDSLIKKIQESEQFENGFIVSERLAAAYLDMGWHTITKNKKYNIDLFEKELMRKIMLPEEIIPRYKSTYFTHIFSGEYASGYYSYLWTDIMVTVAFETYKDKIFDKNTGYLFRKEILEKSNILSADELLKTFINPNYKINYTKYIN